MSPADSSTAAADVVLSQGSNASASASANAAGSLSQGTAPDASQGSAADAPDASQCGSEAISFENLRDAILLLMKPPEGLTKDQLWNVAQQMAKLVKRRLAEELEELLLAAKQKRHPRGVWLFELRPWHPVAQATEVSISCVLKKTG